MKKSLLFSVAILMVFCTSLAFSQTGKICNWNNDSKGTVVLTFDDWSPGHFPVVLPELNARSLKATFFLTLKDVAPWNHDWPDVITTASYGHELGNHTVTHPDLTTKTSAQLHDEITGTKNTIEQQVPGQKVLTFAYPYGDGAGSGTKDIEIQDTIKASGHIAARAVSPAASYPYNFAPTEDSYYQLPAYAMSSSVTTNVFAAELNKAINGGGLLIYLYHSVDDLANSHGDNWYSKVVVDSLRKQLDTIVNLQTKLWVATLAQAIKYHREKNSATLTEVQAPNGTSWIVDLTDLMVDNSVYNQPLTIKLKMNGIAYDHIIQNGNALSYTITGDTIMFNALPDGGQIAISVGALAPNLAPTLDVLPNKTIDQHDGTQTINLSGISAGAGESQALAVTAVAYNSTLIQNILVNYSSPNATGTLSFSPNPADAGNTTIVVRVTDGGTPARFTEQSFIVAVTGNVLLSTKNETAVSENDLVVSPIPTSGMLTICSDKILVDAAVSIDDASGNNVYQEFFSSTEKFQLNFSGQKPGIYFLKIKTAQGYVVKKLVVF